MLKKLIPVLGLLAFVAGPVFAADTAPATTTPATSTHKSTHKTSAHHTTHHHHNKKTAKTS